MNQKGIVFSGLIYALLTFFLLLLAGLLMVLWYRQSAIHNLGKDANEIYEDFNTPPVITLLGESIVTIAMNSTYEDAGATAFDNENGDLTWKISVASDLNTTLEGTYTITYTVTDVKGIITTATRTVNVIEISYVESKGVNKPKLAKGMTAIKWDTVAKDWIKVDNPDTDESWYQYGTTKSTRNWANAVTNDCETPGDYDTCSMWVWIPRYAYQIASGYHSSSAGTIHVKFLKNKTNIASDGSTVATTPTYSDADTQSNYIVHPAFNFGGTQLTGIWVAKFEASAPTNHACYNGDADDCNNTNVPLRFVPNVRARRYTSVGNQFVSSRLMETNDDYGWTTIPVDATLGSNGIFSTESGANPNYNGVDTHMMKNTEWGAVAYLSKSTYGINAEIYKNPSSSYVTGRGGGAVSSTQILDYGNDSSTGLYGYDGKSCSSKTGYVCMGTTHGTYGTASSTTGNIYGIYDTSGGSFEYVMGNYNDLSIDSGITDVSVIDAKYIDRYTAYDDTKYGDAVYETSKEATSYSKTSWYSDYSSGISSSYPWFYRGGSSAGGTDTGIYFFVGSGGGAFNNTGFRSVLLVNEGF